MMITITPLSFCCPVGWGAVEYTDCIFAGGGKLPSQTSVLDMTALEIGGMQSTPLLPLLQGSLWPGVVAPDRVLSMSQIKVFDI